jgi:hypothetical protein
MKRGFLLALVAALAGVTALHAVGNLPRFRSSGDSPLSAEEKVAMKAWFMEQYQVRQHFGTDRVSIQRIGAQEEKNPDGTPFRRVVAHARNYTTGMVTRLTARLDDNSLAIDDIGYGAMQTTAEEQDRVVAIIKADPRLRALNEDVLLELQGGFVIRAEDPNDPCAREVCVQYGYMGQDYDVSKRRMVIVNLSRERVVNTDYQNPPEGANRARMTEDAQ